MSKLLPSLALALVASAGALSPALATDSLTSSSGFDSFDAGYQLQRLQDAGVPATSVAEDWNGRMRATVELSDGSRSFQYFDIDSLQQVGTAGAATRVMTDLDVQRTPFQPTMESLVYQGDE